MTTPVPIRAEASDIEYLLDDGVAVHGVGDGGVERILREKCQQNHNRFGAKLTRK